MKKTNRLLALILSGMLTMTGCGLSANDISDVVTEITSITSSEISSIEAEISTTAADMAVNVESDIASSDDPVELSFENLIPEFNDLSDEALLGYVEDNIYTELVKDLNSSDYFVEDVSAVYVSKEYLEELEYNSRSNIFFGYTLEEVEETFGNSRYIFTLGEDGTTIVKPFEDYDDTYEQVIKNVAIGTGVILICVTVSAITAGAGAPAVSMIFAASAKSATTFALSSGALSGVASGVITEIETGDFNKALKAAALAASEDFKWGSIIGAVAGGVSESISVKNLINAGVTQNGLTLKEAAKIQKETKWSLDVIKSLHSVEEAEIYKKAQLTAKNVCGKKALIRKIDWDKVDEMGRTNIERVLNNLAPIGPDGKPFELHHVGQKTDTPLAILTNTEHHSQANFSILHYAEEGKGISEAAWKKIKDEFWMDMLKMSGVL